MFWSSSQALDYLRSKVAPLFAARGQLQDALGRAFIARSKAHTPETRLETNQLIQNLEASLQKQNELEVQVRKYLPSSMTSNLGIIPLLPVIAVGGGVVMATAVYNHLQNVAAQRQALTLIEKGLLTPEQAKAITSSGGIFGMGGLSGLAGNVSTIVIVGAIAYALFLFGPTLAGKLAGKK